MIRMIGIFIACFFSLVAMASENKIYDKSNIIMFISFSMPKQSLISYLHDAKKIHASVVIRGLLHNSFKETFAMVADLVKESGGGVELNPPLFKKFNIQTVPAIVVLSNSSSCLTEQSCSDKDFDKISGDVPLAYVLKEIRDKGEVAQQNAGDFLQILRGASNA